MIQFAPASKKAAKARVAIIGLAGSGKTYTALQMACRMGQKVAVVDTEHGSASKYSDLFRFDVVELDSFEPETYIDAMKAAYRGGYDVVVLDSLSHAWAGVGGLLEAVGDETARSKSGNSFAAWRSATPRHNALVEAMLACPMHLIVTMRSKPEYVIEKDERTGRQSPRKIGMAPVQRDGLEYEFDLVADMDADNTLVVTKSRCPQLNRAVVHCPGDDFTDALVAWLSDAPDGSAANTEKVAAVENSDEATRKACYAKISELKLAEDAEQLKRLLTAFRKWLATQLRAKLLAKDGQTMVAAEAAYTEQMERLESMEQAASEDAAPSDLEG